VAENERIVDIYRPNMNAKPDDPPSKALTNIGLVILALVDSSGESVQTQVVLSLSAWFGFLQSR
jgi:hypothetical protein